MIRVPRHVQGARERVSSRNVRWLQRGYAPGPSVQNRSVTSRPLEEVTWNPPLLNDHVMTPLTEDGPATPVSSRTARSNVQGRDSFNSPRQRLNSSHPSTLDEGLSDEDHNTRRYASTSQRNLTDNVIHTLVSKPNDALALLFEAAGRQDPSALNSTRQSPDTSSKELEVEHQNQPLESSSRVAEHYTLNNIPTPHSTNASVTATIPSPSAETQEIWKRYRFVRQGWLTALEAIQYVDLYVLLFFQNGLRGLILIF
jgi:hypothetical protein